MITWTFEFPTLQKTRIVFSWKCVFDTHTNGSWAFVADTQYAFVVFAECHNIICLQTLKRACRRVPCNIASTRYAINAYHIIHAFLQTHELPNNVILF